MTERKREIRETLAFYHLISELDAARERAERAEAALEARWGRCSNCGAMSYQVWLDESASGGAG